MAGPSSPWRNAESPGELFTQQIAGRLDLGRVFYKMEQERILKNLDYFQDGSRSRLRTVRYRLDKEVDRSVADVAKFYKKDLDEIYRAGLIGGGLDQDYKLGATDTPNIADIRNQGLRRSRQMGERAKKRNRKVMDFRSISRKDAQKLGDQHLNPKIGNVSWNNMTYQTMAIRTDAQKTFNLGVIDGAKRSKTKALRCIDGPGCGLISHDDPFKVNGELFSIEDARKYNIAHPNCTRRWEPAPDEKKPPPIGRRKAELLGTSKALQRTTELADFVNRNVDIDYMALAIDLATDAQMRELVFNTILRAKDSWVGFRQRIDALISKYLGDAPTDDEIFDRMIHYLDEMASGARAPEWVYEVLNVRSGETLIAAGDDFHSFVRVNRIASATHAELNMVNRLENHYGHFFQARLSAAHPNASDGLVDLYKGIRSQYNEPRFHFGGKTISIPRLGGEAFRGPRFTWGSRPIKIQTTLVNKNRHMTREELRAAMAKIGLVPQVHTTGLAGDAVRGMLRHEMIEALGYNPGLLSHLTLNPHGVFRMGFRMSPTGWIQPDIRLVPKTIPLRYSARLNRGMPVDGFRVRSVTQEFRAVFGGQIGVDLPKGGRLSLPSVGVSTNTVVGRLERFDDLKRIVMNFTRPGTNLSDQPIELLREQARFITKGQAIESINALDKDQLIEILRDWGAGLSGREMLLRNTEVLSMFAELRLTGYSHFRISKILRITPEEALEMVNAVSTQFGELWRERSMQLFMQVAAQQAVAAVQGGVNYAFVNPLQSAINAYRHTQHIMDDFTGWLGDTGKNTFAGKIYRDGVEGYQFVQDFQKGSFGADLITRYGPKIDGLWDATSNAYRVLFDPNQPIDWRKVAQRAIMSPPQLMRFMKDMGISVGRTIGYEVGRGSKFIHNVLSSNGPIAEFFKHAEHTGDNVYNLGGVVFQADSPGVKGKGFFLRAGATVSDVLRLRALQGEIAELASKHQADVIKGVTTLRDSANKVLATVTPEIRKRLTEFNKFLDLSLDEMEETLSQLADLLITTNRKLTDEELQSFMLARKTEGPPLPTVVGNSQKIGGYGKRQIRKMESAEQDAEDLKLPAQVLFKREDFTKEYWDEFGEVLEEINGLHSARRGLRAAEGGLQVLTGEAPQLGFQGFFRPMGFTFKTRRFNNGQLVVFNTHKGMALDHTRMLNTFSHELGHAQDFDFHTNSYVSRIGANVHTTLRNTRQSDTPGLYHSLEGDKLVDFDTLADQLIGKDIIIMDGGLFPIRVTRETIAQAKFYNAWESTESAAFMRMKWVEASGTNSLRAWAEADYISYLMDPAEIWARSYSQRVAYRNGVAKAMWKDYMTMATDENFRQQYRMSDYRKLQKYIDAVLEERGVLN